MGISNITKFFYYMDILVKNQKNVNGSKWNNQPTEKSFTRSGKIAIAHTERVYNTTNIQRSKKILLC